MSEKYITKENIHRAKIRRRNSLLIAAAFLLCCIIIVGGTVPGSYDITVGEISGYTITAPRDFVDEINTNREIEEAKAKVGPVYVKSNEFTDDATLGVSNGIQAIETTCEQAREIYISKQLDELRAAENARVAQAQAEGDSAATARNFDESDVEYNSAQTDWESFLSDENKNSLIASLPDYFSAEDLYEILALDYDKLGDILGSLENACNEKLSEGFTAEEQSEKYDEIIISLTESYELTDGQISAFRNFLENAMNANVVFDEQATKAAQDSAADSVSPIEYKKGQNIVRSGEIVTQQQYDVLSQAGLLGQTTDNAGAIGIIVYLAAVFAAYMVYLLVFGKRLLESIKYTSLIAIMTVVAVCVQMIISNTSISVIPMFIFVILFAAVISRRQAFPYAVFLALTVAAAMSPSREFISERTFYLTIMSVLGSLLSIVVVGVLKFRGALILAGLVSCIPCFAVYCVLLNMNEISLSAFLNMLMWTVSGNILCGVVSVGLLPFVETVFRLTTPTKLLELSDPSQPLLRRLMVEAPGTYHHSLYVANLAEAACEAIGGNSLLARVGAYYHDVGKLIDPGFFVENQRYKINSHDDMNPKLCAEIIIGHVSYGLELLEKAKMPYEIRKILSEHHGDTAVMYFYAKAKEIDENTDINDFRYPGSKPSTKESAVIMLADSVEAALRSMKTFDDELLTETVNKIIDGKIKDGQLKQAPVTFKEISIIKEAFEEIYKGSVHSRIEYPELKEEEKNESDNL